MKDQKGQPFWPYFIEKLNTHRPTRWMFMLLLSTYTILFVGYYFGTFDQASHIPYLLKSINPNLYPNDYFMDIRYEHYSYFWFLFKPLYHIGLLEVGMFALHVFSTWLTFIMLWRLGRQIYKDALIAALICLCFISMHLSFGGFSLFEFSVLNRTFALPFLLLAISWWLDHRPYRAMMLLGIMYNFHALSVHFVLAMFGLDVVLSAGRSFNGQYAKRMIIMSAAFLVPALPIFIWKFGNSSIDISVNMEWFQILSRGMLSHLFFPLDISKPFNTIFTLSGISAIAIYFYSAQYINKKIKLARHINHFMLAVSIVLIIGVASSYLYPATILVQAQIIRIGLFGLLFGYMHGIAYLVDRYRHGAFGEKSVVVMLSTLLTSPLTFIAIVFYALIRTFNRPILWLFVYVVVLLSTYIGSYSTGLWQPGVFIREQDSAYVQVQRFARHNTPIDAVFITLPSEWFFYNYEWRVLSQRSTVVTLADLLEIAFAPSKKQQWKQRFDDVAPGALVQFEGDYVRNREIAREAYNKHTTSSITTVAHKYGATYVVTQKQKIFNLPLVYENDQYRVYQIAAGP